MEFKGIPFGHLYRPDTSTPTLEQKPIKVTSFQELDEFMKKQDIKPVDYADLEDIDDTMDAETAQVGLVGAIVPELPQRDFNIRTLTNDRIAELRKDESDGGYMECK